MTFMTVEDATLLIQLEYLELPDLKLTPWQAQRLWNLSDELCTRALFSLVERRFLMRLRDGSYARRETADDRAESVRSLLRAM